MQKFMGLLISGLATGAIYSVMASCLVLSFETSGIFNFALPAIAFTCAYFYYQMNTALSIPIVPAAILTVLVFAPLLGTGTQQADLRSSLDRTGVRAGGRHDRRPHRTAELRRCGSSARSSETRWAWASPISRRTARTPVTAYRASGRRPPKVFSLSWVGLHDVRLNTDQVAVFVFAAVAAAVLYVVIRRTQVGLQMRAQVDRASLATLRGIDPNRTSGIAWMLSVTLASLAGDSDRAAVPPRQLDLRHRGLRIAVRGGDCRDALHPAGVRRRSRVRRVPEPRRRLQVRHPARLPEQAHGCRQRDPLRPAARSAGVPGCTARPRSWLGRRRAASARPPLLAAVVAAQAAVGDLRHAPGALRDRSPAVAGERAVRPVVDPRARACARASSSCRSSW